MNDINSNSFNKVTSGFSIPTGVIVYPKNTSTPNESVNDVLVKQNSDNQKHNKSLGKKVLYSTLAIGTIALLLTKGFSGRTAKYLKNLAIKIENNWLKKISNSKISEKVNSGVFATQKFVKKISLLSNGIANFTSVKDAGFRNLYSLNFLKFKNPDAKMFPLLAKSWNWVLNLPTRFFNFATKNILKITENAIDTNYARVAGKLDKGIAKGVQLIENSTANAADKNAALNLLNKINTVYTEGFSKTARNARFKTLNDGLSNLNNKVDKTILSPIRKLFGKNKLSLKQRFALIGRRFKKNYSSYITVNKSKVAKAKHINAINTARMAFSNDIKDVTKSLQFSANELKQYANDIESQKMLGHLLKKIEEYGKDDKIRSNLQEEIIKNIEAFSQKVKTQAGKNKNIKNIDNIVNSMKETMTEYSKKGEIQNLQTLMKKILSPEDYKKWCNISNGIHSEFNKAVNAEINVADKISESIVGSIATDVTSQALVIGGCAYHITTGEDKKERIGTSLKLGMPILGGIATYFYSASKALSGTTNLALIVLSTFLLNRIGNSVFNYYNKRYVENKPVKEIAKEAVEEVTKV